MNRKNLAVIGVGILGSGQNDEGIPVFVQALQKLTQHYFVTVYSFIPVNKEKVPIGIRVRYVPWRIHMRLQYIFMAILFGWDTMRNRYHVIHAQSPFPAGVFASWMSRIYGVRWLLSFHAGEAASMPEISFGDLLRPSLKRVSIRVAGKAKIITAMSEFQATDIRKNLRVKDVHVLPRGINVPAFKERKLMHPIQFVHISNYHPVKDYDTLLKAFALIVKKIDATLKIVGGKYENSMQEKINSMQLSGRVKLAGHIPHHQLTDIYNEAHILLHTSHYEGLPGVVLEAMAHGVLVCGTRAGIISDLADKCCVAVSAGDYEGLANKTLSLIEHKDEFEKLQRQAHAWVSEHDVNWYVRELIKCYDSIGS